MSDKKDGVAVAVPSEVYTTEASESKKKAEADKSVPDPKEFKKLLEGESPNEPSC